VSELYRYYSTEASSILALHDDGSIILPSGKVWQHRPESMSLEKWLAAQREIYESLPPWQREFQPVEWKKKSDWIKVLDDIKLGHGVSGLGDFERIRATVYGYNARHRDKHFVVRRYQKEKENRVLIYRDK
jgi:hypothetical protein